jgi:APA family basic amino acid/polyamine antiporter
MARDGLFFGSAGTLNKNHVPAWGLIIQGIWASLLVLPRTVTNSGEVTGQAKYGNLYNDLLVYVISAALIFYILTIIGIFVLRRSRPDAERPYRAFGYPVLPALYVLIATVVLVVLFVFQTAITWPGLVLVATGIPAFFIWRRFGKASQEESDPPIE